MELALYHQDTNQIQQVTIQQLDELSDLIEVYFGIKPHAQRIEFNSQQIIPNKSFKDYQIKNGDLLLINQKLHKEDHIENVMEQAFISHTLLYLRGECNDVAFKILVDTGAEVSVMSEYMAKRLELNIDTRMQREARGVGVAKILGMVYNCNLKLENNMCVPVNFNVMESNEPNFMLLGLDFLYNNACHINLVNRTIMIQNKEFKLLNEIKVQELDTPYDCRKENIKKLYQRMVASINSDKRNDVIDILNKILTNIIKNPLDDKYKNINTNNKVINEIIKESNDFIEFMKKIGFVMTNDNKLKFIENPKILDYTKSIMVA